jgi:hypothetical protein
MKKHITVKISDLDDFIFAHCNIYCSNENDEDNNNKCLNCIEKLEAVYELYKEN